MSEQAFVSFCKQEVLEYLRMKSTDAVSEQDICVVWLSKALQNNKAVLISTAHKGVYFEVTYDGYAQECYVDVYHKIDAYVVAV